MYLHLKWIKKNVHYNTNKSDFKSLYFNNVGANELNFVKKYCLSSGLLIDIKVFQKMIVTEIVKH